MPTYTYRCPVTEKTKDFTLPMDHDKPTCSDIMTEEECKEAGCSPDQELQRVYTPVHHTYGMVDGKTQRPTDSTSATKEKNEKLKKLYKDSYVGMENYDNTPSWSDEE